MPLTPDQTHAYEIMSRIPLRDKQALLIMLGVNIEGVRNVDRTLLFKIGITVPEGPVTPPASTRSWPSTDDQDDDEDEEEDDAEEEDVDEPTTPPGRPDGSRPPRRVMEGSAGYETAPAPKPKKVAPKPAPARAVMTPNGPGSAYEL